MRSSGRALCLVLVLVGCGHTTPYVATGQPGRVPALATEDLACRLILVGDAGATGATGDPVLAALGAVASERPERTTLFLLGDNVYPRGADGTDEARERLTRQLEIVARTGVRGVVLPGNHDWDNDGPDGWDAVTRQAEEVEAYSRAHDARLAFVPAAGAPGPVILDDIHPALRVVALDTQWWIYEGRKPDRARATFLDDLRRALTTAGDRRTIVVAHHPLATCGSHGGFFPWPVHVFPLTQLAGWLYIPLPLLGSLYPLARRLGVSDQDLSGSDNRALCRGIIEACREVRPILYAAGHDHNLQLFRLEDGPRYHGVSGAGSREKLTPVSSDDRTLFAHGHVGFMVLDRSTTGRFRLAVVEPDDAGVASEVFSCWLE